MIPASDRTRFSDARLLDREAMRDRAELWSETSSAGMVAAAHYRATEAGVAMLDAGGDAIDAAIATSLALAVAESAGSGIGGMAIMLVHLAQADQTFLLAGPCIAPRAATPELVAASSRYSGYRAVAVPGYPAVIRAALRYASLPRQVVMQPAIALAQQGFRLTPLQQRLLDEYGPALRRSRAADLFLASDGSPPPVGRAFRQPTLASTLQRLADAGWDDFYRGDIARQIACDMAESGGFIDETDLASVPDLAPSQPVECHVSTKRVATAGFPAGGRTLLQMLNLYEALTSDRAIELDTPEGAAMLAAIIRQARRDRRTYRLAKPGGPDVASKAFAAGVAPALREELGTGETSHLCVVDREGNAVSMTQSIERSFGAKVATPSLGFLYNGYMRAFKIQARNHPHYLRPGAVARSNAAPTFLFGPRGVEVAIGSTGSERMLSGIFQVLARLEAGQDPFAAVHAPRLHATPESVLLIERERFDARVIDDLEGRGYAVQDVGAYAYKFGGLHLVARRNGRWVGVAEPRRDGAAAAPGNPQV